MKKVLIATASVFFILVPVFSFAATKNLFYGAWLPFWKKQAGAQDVALNLEKFHEISPFSYEVKSNGSLRDSLKITDGFWPVWFTAVKDMNIKIIPTVALFDRNLIYRLLSSAKLRKSHEEKIMAMVKSQKFDGVDIDYEDKSLKTKIYFSAFIKELSKKLHANKKSLSCTIEGRTPASSQFQEIPPELPYANDYKVLNKYCDEVRIMAYDQGNIDLKMNSQKGTGRLYMPVADKDWVEKVVKETLKTISRKKIMLGVPTYGYVYNVSQASSTITYKRLRSVTFFQAMNLADSVSATPERNSAGELSFSYATSSQIYNLKISASLIYTINSSSSLNLVSTKDNPATNYVSFSDAAAIADKIKLAKKYKLRGIMIFKMDGEADPAIWQEIK